MGTAKALGWCVHEIEQVEVDGLERAGLTRLDDNFIRIRKPNGSFSRCHICQSNDK
jgi:hypothetical protein